MISYTNVWIRVGNVGNVAYCALKDTIISKLPDS